MTRRLGGEQSLKAEVFELEDGSQMGHCTIKGVSAASQVYGRVMWKGKGNKLSADKDAEKFCSQGWDGHCVHVSLGVLEKEGNKLKILEGPKQSQCIMDPRRVAPTYSPGAALYVLDVESPSCCWSGKTNISQVLRSTSPDTHANK
jgi:hypothetical protein